MKKTILMTGCLVLLFIASLLGCASSVTALTEDNEEIQTLNKAWGDAINQGAKNITEQYAATAHIITPDHQILTGHETIAGELFSRFPKTGVAVSSIETLVLVPQDTRGYFEIGRIRLGGSADGESMLYGTIWRTGKEGLVRQFGMMHFESPTKSYTDSELDSIVSTGSDILEDAFRQNRLTPDLYTDDGLFYWGYDGYYQGGQEISGGLGQGDYQFSTQFAIEVSESMIYELGLADDTSYLMVWEKNGDKWQTSIDSYLES